MSENAFWKEIKRGMESCPDHISYHFSRIESPVTSPGFPDVEGTIDGVSNQMELKFINNRRKDGNRLTPNFFRDTQHLWFRSRMKAFDEDKGMPFVFTKINGWGYTVHRGSVVLALKDVRTKPDWIGVATFVWTPEIDWGFLPLIFKGEI